MADMKLVKQFAATMKEANKRTEPYDTPAEVVRIEGNTAWVHIPGGVDETPVQLTVNAEEGDTVQVRVGGGSAWITGNATAPPTDDKTANAAKQTATEAQEAAVEASDTATRAARNADSAIKIAGNTAQHFWHTEEGTDTGAHITEVPMEEFLEDPENGGGNLLARSNGIAIRDGLTELASFGETTQIGEDGNSRLKMDYHSLELIDKDGESYFYVSDLRNRSGVATIKDIFKGNGIDTVFNLSYTATNKNYTVSVHDGSGGTITKTRYTVTFSTAPTDGTLITCTYETTESVKAYTLGSRDPLSTVGPYSVVIGESGTASGNYSYSEGYNTNAQGFSTHAEGTGTTASAEYSHAEGMNSTASGIISHAEGSDCTASGSSSHAEGSRTTSSKTASHAEGYNTTASGNYSHTEGYNTTASSSSSHAEGHNTVASGTYSHAQNDGTIAASTDQTALGRFNVQDSTNQLAVIVGNGTSNTSRSNALTLGWNGDLKTAGEIEDGNGTSISDLLAKFTDFFKIKEYPYAYSNLNPGAGLNISATDFGFSRPTGYVPIAFLRTNSGSVNVSVIGANVQATGSVAAMSIYNHSNAARSYTASITVLYARSSMVTTV